MTDFLTRLAERSLGVGEVVQPRPASLFDLRGAVDTPTLVDDLEVVVERITVPASRTSARLHAAAPQPAEEPRAATERLPAPPPGAVYAPAPEPVESSGEHEPRSAQTAAVATPPPVEPPLPSVAPDPAVEAADDDARPPAPAPAPAPRTVVVQPMGVELREPDVMTPERPRRRPHTAQVPPSAVPARPPGAGEPEPAAAAPAAREPDWLHAPPAPAQARATAAELDAEPPVVHVTIGRVDVRAVLPAAPPERAKSRRRPRMTLDEYLCKDGRP